MGYSYYVIDGMERGYGVVAKCDHPGCDAEIDRGLAYLCYSCTGYFCEEHRTYGDTEFECFAGDSRQACKQCADNPDGEQEAKEVSGDE